MISAIQWIRKGVASQQPEKYNLDEAEYERIHQLAAQHLEEANQDLKDAEGMDVTEEGNAAATDPDLVEFNLDKYDEEIAADQEKNVNIFSNKQGLTYYASNQEDPYITLKDVADDEEERAELEILPTDNLIVAAKTEDDLSHLEIYVYEESEDNLYVHHDLLLPAFPLCLDWLDFKLGRKAGQAGTGNYVAVGTFDPDIEIWDLDSLDVMYPDAILGHTDKTKKRSKKVNDNYHVDAVMGLAWNKNHRNIIASSSADTTVKLWDLNTCKCARSFRHHKDKVQAVQWHPVESTVLLTGSYDKTVTVFDSRSPDNVTSWNVGADVETLRWDPHNPTNYYVATEDGLIRYYDVRSTQGQGVGGAALFTLHAHDDAVSSFDVNPLVPGCIVTGSTDKSIKVWDTADNKPRMVTSRNLGVGKIFSAQFCTDSPFQLAVAGSKGNLQVLDLSSNAGVRRAFSNRAGIIVPEVPEKKPVELPDDAEPESEGETEPVADDNSNHDNDSDMDDDYI
ncbi:rRNA-processing protein [Umbelopsis nana]